MNTFFYDHIPTSRLSAFVIYLDQFIRIGQEAKTYLTEHTRTMTVPAEKPLVERGSKATYLYYVHSGGLRYHIGLGRCTISPAIFLPGCVAPHPWEVYYQLPLLHELRSMKQTLVSFIELDRMIYAITRFSEIREALPQILLAARSIHTERELWEKWPPQKKLLSFVERYPQFYLSMQAKILASYLAMSPEHLSRLLSKKVKRK